MAEIKIKRGIFIPARSLQLEIEKKGKQLYYSRRDIVVEVWIEGCKGIEGKLDRKGGNWVLGLYE